MRNRLIVSLAAAGLMLATGIGTAEAASAATPSAGAGAGFGSASSTATGRTAATVRPAIEPGCAATYFCFWNNENFNDGPGKLSGNNPSWFVFSHSSCPNGTWANCASSLDNAGTSGMGVEVWSSTGYNGDHACVSDNETYSDLANNSYSNGDAANDSIESNEWTWAC
ncbi:peptidase inhibitor family I36 protein [Streptacidiphilus albus]|uniref:peptidase inhibitor family I36 protein n=1 Tax=Streptacidiphilus albus TaxID=105425 RepID=UPI00054C4705|nr:peptidase inhibitor family I36 protein [Streptacidiphilus albus]